MNAMSPDLPQAQDAGGSESRVALLARAFAEIKASEPLRFGAAISSISPTHYELSRMPANVSIGDLVEHISKDDSHIGEVVGIERDRVTIAPYDGASCARIGDPVFRRGTLALPVSPEWKGRVINALGRPVDSGAPLVPHLEAVANNGTPPALARARVERGFRTGVRAIDIFTPLCYGQRIGVFAGSGVGKSTLLAMLAAADAFDTVVVGMVGERGREVREFLEDTLGAKNLRKTVAVVATSDEAAMMRRRAPDTAMRIAEYFRDRGERVLLILDSITRFAHALREVATATGEPPVARGYPASVFTALPQLLERAGPGEEGKGSITAVISVLVDGDDHNDPVADAVRGILDGHVVLDRAIASEGRFPAIDTLASISRLANKAWSNEERILVGKLKAMVARFEETRDIRLMGAYQAGADPDLDQAVRQVPQIYKALVQSPQDPPSRDPFNDLARYLRVPEPSNVQQ
ncbi:flagellar protein export ATPase FliI [Limoniibacter endophyticus]|uniref:Flagellum-specific ATP synthase n=1 Tax=Limoniibacter endophyticus TaxID=1565040 RepID=A0A8J3DEW5_9HYPH|nr:flagellar protein export ATPase FliI [Limoniibacter endophyticus]GHC64612.1 flagellum-specific ATP synthase FliI [Limoniibacter endophyticus]